MADAFISYRSTAVGEEISQQLFGILSERGIDSFLDARKIYAGDDFTREILAGVERSRVVIVLFEAEPSSWVHFEAACAFFDQKLIPVSVNGADVPSPYNQIHHESLDHAPASQEALNRVADQVEDKLRGAGADSRSSAVQQWIVRSFRWGWWALLAIPVTLLLVPDLSALELAQLGVAVLGALYLGGLFFLALAFAQALSAPGFRARQAGFRTTEGVFRIWLWLGFFIPMPALAIWAAENGIDTVPGWLFLSLCAYASSLSFALAGYLLLRGTRRDEATRRQRKSVVTRTFFAYLLFATSFLWGVWVCELIFSQEVSGLANRAIRLLYGVLT